MAEVLQGAPARSIHDVLAKLRSASTSERDKGDRFERLMQSLLRVAEPWATRFDEVWLWQEWPDRAGRTDAGIDLVARERDGGGLCAIQCKCYDPEHTLQKGDIDSFFTASGKSTFTSRLIVSTTDRWSTHAEQALDDQHVAVTRLRVQDLDALDLDWALVDVDEPSALPPIRTKQLREHQRAAIDDVLDGLAEHDRGKLIMACGTGKTYTSLKLVEKYVPERGSVLFLVPSISLLAQSLAEWTMAADRRLHPIAVCSDPKASAGTAKSEDVSVHDLAFPASTNPARIVEQASAIEAQSDGITVVFSTYQSLGAIADAQAAGLPKFDLVICDEAHRTTGVTIAGEDDSAFTRIHDASFIAARKRLYMTATPRIYGDESKAKASEGSAAIASMDDESIYGPELHRLGFGAAVERGLLTDYKVLVLAVDEHAVERSFQRMMTEHDGTELKLDDVARIVGCWNGLAKRGVDRSRLGVEDDLKPMRRAVAFARDIKASKHAVELFELVSRELEMSDDTGTALQLRARHVDGTTNVLERGASLDWLKADTASEGPVCRILSNARCLSEGVDVPALDSVVFLNPRRSEVDVVQSVGRVMRLAADKQFGYIILPVGVPADMTPEEALRDNKRYEVVWKVLQALRAHDDRFDAIVNQIELNTQRDDKLQVIGVGSGEDGGMVAEGGQQAMTFAGLDEWRDALYAKIVKKVGTRLYLDQWTSDIAELAEANERRISALIADASTEVRERFDEFVNRLRFQINESVDEADARGMLAQHLIAKPVFEALFEGWSFIRNNPIAQAMDAMFEVLEGHAMGEAHAPAKLQRFYESVRVRVAGIDNPEGKQRVIVELYDGFFAKVFPKVRDQLGIVYTPPEVIDFILGAVETVLHDEFDGASMSDEGVHVIDPFTGTGSFITRLILSGYIRREDLPRKFGVGGSEPELHANEILLLAYYIAAVNIEATYHGYLHEGETGEAAYAPFGGIVLTDTFRQSEAAGTLDPGAFGENDARAQRQNRVPIQVVVGNPPYSAGANSQNDDNANLKYPVLDARIEQTYAARSTATNKNSLYDSYIRAIRWASDRIQDHGVIAFVTNGAFIDSNTADGLRKVLADEFTDIWIYNLRGAARGAGDIRRREAGNVFGGGSRTSVAVSMFVKKASVAPGAASLRYRDIGDYLTGEQKLALLQSIPFIDVDWREVSPNEHGDWINQRDTQFTSWPALGNKRGNAVFSLYSGGIKTNRDAWNYARTRSDVIANVERSIEHLNAEIKRVGEIGPVSEAEVRSLVDMEPASHSWNVADFRRVLQGIPVRWAKDSIHLSLYRPFDRMFVYAAPEFNDRLYRLNAVFPVPSVRSRGIHLTGAGSGAAFTALMTDLLPNLHLVPTGQFFPRYTYEAIDPERMSIAADGDIVDGYRRIDNISPDVLAEYRGALGADISGDDLFDYVYGLLHSPEYRRQFSADLNKMLPRIPRVRTRKDFDAFAAAGQALGDLHVGYEQQDPYALDEIDTRAVADPWERNRVVKMKFAKERVDGKLEADRSRVVYNHSVTLAGIPDDAYRYQLGPRSAVEWVMDRYQVRTDKASGIVNDPNDWSREVDDPRYIIDLLKRVVTVSLETNRIVDALPALDIAD